MPPQDEHLHRAVMATGLLSVSSIQKPSNVVCGCHVLDFVTMTFSAFGRFLSLSGLEGVKMTSIGLLGLAFDNCRLALFRP